MNSVVIVTGAAGLVGSACVRRFCGAGLHVVGIDNNMRGKMFGPDASTEGMLSSLSSEFPKRFTGVEGDVRDGELASRIIVEQQRTGKLIGVVHAAAQPSHDYAVVNPLLDFSINAEATLTWLRAVQEHAHDTVFIQVSTNKVYGDLVNRRAGLVEHKSRYSSPTFPCGIDESFSIDQSKHSLFGVSKLYGDLVAQEYGRYLDVPTVIFRCGCITGASHAGVEAHGFLSYLVKCAISDAPYTVYGYQGKQVRDQLHAEDLADAFLLVINDPPPPGTVYNMGGGVQCNCSVLEAMSVCAQKTGRPFTPSQFKPGRAGDHMWWISDTRKFEGDYPHWVPKWDLPGMVGDIIEANTARKP